MRRRQPQQIHRDSPQLWLIPLDELADEPACMRVLNSEERRRAQQFRFTCLTRRYAAGRAALRMLLAEALDVSPQAIPLEAGPLGKPRLAHRAAISFNVSHCGGTAVIGLAAGESIGVDVESAAYVHDPGRLARTFFDASEATTVERLPPALATTAFLRCWTAKEAVLKALGVGLSLPLDAVVVDADPHAPLRLRRVPPPSRPSDWTLQGLMSADSQVVIAVAVGTPNAPAVRVRHFDPARFRAIRPSSRR